MIKRIMRFLVTFVWAFALTVMLLFIWYYVREQLDAQDEPFEIVIQQNQSVKNRA